MRYLIGLVALATAGPAVVAKPVQVDGHVRRDGTYVPPHTRTAPNSTVNDNWSTKPNVNPTTGKAGTREPSWGSSSNNGRSRESSAWGY